MSNSDVLEATTREAVLRCHGVFQELRPQLVDAEAFADRVMRQREAGYRLVYRERDGAVCAAAGFRVGENLAWARFLYVDDLITGAAFRKQGHAQALMDFLYAEARRLGCGQVHLDSGVQRFDAHRLYLNAKMRITSHHFGIELG